MNKEEVIKIKIDKAIENLYTVFSKYKVDYSISGCPCCVNDKHKKLLLSRPLKELEYKQIGRYAFKAITTWGTIENFKHYLPRIFELLIQRELPCDEFVLFNKLDYADWLFWDNKEINALKELFVVWAEYNIKTDWIDLDLIIEIIKKINDPLIILELWELSYSDNSIVNFCSILSHEGLSSLKKAYIKMEVLDSEKIGLIDNWATNKVNQLIEDINSGKIIALEQKIELEEAIFIYRDNYLS